jgi:hypothetical protein
MSIFILAPLEKFPQDLKLFVSHRMPITVADDDVQDLKYRRNFSSTNHWTSKALYKPHADIFRHMDVYSVVCYVDLFEDFQTYSQMVLLNKPVISFFYQLFAESRFQHNC